MLVLTNDYEMYPVVFIDAYGEGTTELSDELIARYRKAMAEFIEVQRLLGNDKFRIPDEFKAAPSVPVSPPTSAAQ